MRFPQMHIAQSVANRILNIADGIRTAQSVQASMPAIPDPTAAGQAIDAAVQAPGVAAAPPAGSEDLMMAAALEGESPHDEAIAAEIIS